MNLIEYQVLSPVEFWGLAENKYKLKKMFNQYFNAGYTQYEIQRIIKSGQAYVAVCARG
ncbi:hypothetical protein PDN55_26970 [Bacillus cereus]|nr:hypothetical protein [Bacillus cereus]